MIKRFLLTIATSLTLLVPSVMAPVLAHAATTSGPIGTGVNCGSNLTVNANSGCPDQTGSSVNDVNHLITLIINVFSVIVGLIAVIMIIFGGVRFILSGGDSAATGAARNTVLYAIIGLVIVLLAQIFVHFVLNRVGSTIQGA